MTAWLIKRFVTNKSGENERKMRLACGRLSGVVGITLNAALGSVKVLLGMATGSVAVIADAVNNLSDAAASVMTWIGFALAGRKSDAQHPFGHARYEYMTGVIVSAMVIVVGVRLIAAAYEKIINPASPHADTVSVILLAVFVGVKIWLYLFNIKLSLLIGSASLKATGIDSRNDAITTVAALGVILLHQFAGLNIDGYIGLAVGGFIIYSGLNMVKETAGPLLGQSPDPRTINDIVTLVLGHKGVLGFHDLIVHDYGPGHIFATVHIEIDSREDIFKSHALVDKVERVAFEELHIQLVGHMDPVDTQDPRIKQLSEALAGALSRVDGMLGFHDLRLVSGPEHTNVIFDVVATHGDPESTFKEVESIARETLAAIDPSYTAIVNRDLDFGAAGKK